MIITIDGPAGTGKSTVAHKVAKSLGFMELDTGALYRAVSAACLQFHIDPHNEEAVKMFLLQHPLEVVLEPAPPTYRINTTDLTPFIRSLEVTSIVSYIAANPFVRQTLLPIQRTLVHGRKVVSEGRDMGTTVFPNADIKFYLTASPEVRAQRRYDELKAKKTLKDSITVDAIRAQIEQRDSIDQGREVSPLRKPTDAIEIDTSSMTIEEVVSALLLKIRELL